MRRWVPLWLRVEFRTWKYILRDRRTPWSAKGFLSLAVCYALLPFDLIPDFVPLWGQLDDLVLVAILVLIALSLIPQPVIQDSRLRARSDSDHPE